ncbi:phosphate/phosphite/phosphonate ABC transporter substrate-binding protein [Kovacikia minuta CCNUW1]|uniref:phosphate/phosphite/phosphonate ABC transporter substrate-binding protein n=1 Tax=Kovacikia minuta TaxID=2931930 RepID=UPI001CCFAE9F|nr:phosphate/phosphite/phosphonate ABC transporter substrate-binding protein [Kovacikia minuta]UBF27843.1 phosphate/phosphite/phosphonate ABC transporter substrate-binding protein [Kovacikia minuta CCNUW1]
MRRVLSTGFLLLSCLSIPACLPACNAKKAPSASSSAATNDPKTFRIGTVSDQSPKTIEQGYGKLAKYLQKELKVPVAYKATKDSATTLSAFGTGGLDLVWLNGATGALARSQVPGAVAIALPDNDVETRSVFIANKNSKIPPTLNLQKGLTALKGHSFTFSSESSTEGRLMPQYFLQQAGVKLEDFQGTTGFSKSQDAALASVQAGTYNAGVISQQVWEKRLQDGKTDPNKVDLIWQSPAYPNYHWVINPNVKERFGNDFIQKVQTALSKLNPAVPEQKQILSLFGTEKFVKTDNSKFAAIEKVSREVNTGK